MRSKISRRKEEILMAYTVPSGYRAYTRANLHIETIVKIAGALSKRGETREILQYWWSGSEQSYFLLLKTSEEEDDATCFVSLREMAQV